LEEMGENSGAAQRTQAAGERDEAQSWFRFRTGDFREMPAQMTLPAADHQGHLLARAGQGNAGGKGVNFARPSAGPFFGIEIEQPHFFSV
jgi:hypothetical protein